MPYQLAYKDRYIRQLSPLSAEMCEGLEPFPYFDQESANKLYLELTGAEITKLVSALKTGADLIFPETANDVLWSFLKALSCPPPLPSQNECIEYLPSAGFIHYFPDNPFLVGDKAFGWYKEAWWRFTDFDTWFPDWIDNWISGNTAALLGYLPTDVIFNIESLIAPSIISFLNDGGVLPKIRIDFVGTGQVNVSLLSFPLGGKAIIELDQEPNILDILTGGILDPGAFMVELNRDILTFPPDEYPLVTVPIEVTTPGEHSLYINFIPIIDDAAFPLLFGGGIRGVELCGFAEEGTVGIEQIIWDGCELKAITGAVESVIVTAAEIQACLDLSGVGGGGGQGSISATAKDFRLPSASITTTQTTMQFGASFSHTPTKTNMLCIVKGVTALHSSSTGRVGIQLQWDSANGLYAAETAVQGTSGRQIAISDVWDNVVPNEAHNFVLRFRSQNAGTSTINDSTDWSITILEWDNLDDLFVQDVRYLDGVIQKKIGGVWFDVLDLQALLDPIQAQASAANAAAAAANALAEEALEDAAEQAVINSQQNVIIADHETRIDDLEDRVTSIEDVDLLQINTTLANHETRIDALEAAPPGGGAGTWGAFDLDYVEHSGTLINPSGGIYAVAKGTFENSSPGFPPHFAPNTFGEVKVYADNAMRGGHCVFVLIGIFEHIAGGSSRYWVSINGSAEVEARATTTSGSSRLAMIPIDPNVEFGSPEDRMRIDVREVYSGIASDWGLANIKYLCIEYDPFTLAPL